VEIKIWLQAPDGCFILRQTGRLTVGRNIRLRLRQFSDSPCVEAGSDTSTVTLLVIGGDEKVSLKSETVKYGHESQGTRTQERLCWQAPAAYKKDRPIVSSERAPPTHPTKKNKNLTVKQ
jgi:hypothetical protein